MSKLLDNMMARLIKELNSAEYDKAIATADSAIKFDAECVNAYLYKAVAYQKKKMYEESLPILEEGVKYAKQKQIKAAFIKGMITAYDKIGGDECKAKLAELYLSQLYQEIEEKSSEKAYEYCIKCSSIYKELKMLKENDDMLVKMLLIPNLKQESYKTLVKLFLINCREGCFQKPVQNLVNLGGCEFAKGNKLDVDIALEKILLLGKEVRGAEASGIFTKPKESLAWALRLYCKIFCFIWNESPDLINDDSIEQYVLCSFEVIGNSIAISYETIDKIKSLDSCKAMNIVEKYITGDKIIRKQFIINIAQWLNSHTQNIGVLLFSFGKALFEKDYFKLPKILQSIKICYENCHQLYNAHNETINNMIKICEASAYYYTHNTQMFIQYYETSLKTDQLKKMLYKICRVDGSDIEKYLSFKDMATPYFITENQWNTYIKSRDPQTHFDHLDMLSDERKAIIQLDNGVDQNSTAYQLLISYAKAKPTCTVYYNIGILLSCYKKDYLRAEKAFEKSISLCKEFQMPYHELYKMYCAYSLFDKAQEILERLVSIDPLNWRIYHYLGLVGMKLGHFDNAIVNFQNALRFVNNNPKEQPIYKYSTTIKSITPTLPVPEGNRVILISVPLAECFRQTANYDSAKQCLNNCIKMDTSSTQIIDKPTPIQSMIIEFFKYVRGSNKVLDRKYNGKECLCLLYVAICRNIELTGEEAPILMRIFSSEADLSNQHILRALANMMGSFTNNCLLAIQARSTTATPMILITYKVDC